MCLWSLGPRLGIWVGAIYLLFLLCIVSALGVSSFFYIPSFSFWNWCFFIIKVRFKLTTFFFFIFFFKKNFKKIAFQRKLHHLISLFKTLRFPDTQKKKKGFQWEAMKWWWVFCLLLQKLVNELTCNDSSKNRVAAKKSQRNWWENLYRSEVL